MYSQIIEKQKSISVIGLGYVGLPIALAFAKKVKVIGFDIKSDRVEKMRNKIDPSNELPSSAFDDCDIFFTDNSQDVSKADFHIIAVPTPINKHNLPDLTPLIKASETLGKVLKRGDIVVYESTVYPGATEEDCVPILEQFSGLTYPNDFKVGYSPERINPGDKVHTLENTVKVVSGCDDETLETVAKVYELVIDAGVHRAATIKVAEAAKIIENTQRDVNIALMNELSIIFNKMGINTYDVLEAAGTKWNFLKFQPGLVGGHCIGVDPYYLAFKAQEYRYHPQIIKSGRFVNDSMGYYVAKQLVKKIIATGKSITGSKVLVLGVTFKENVTDIRNSKVADVITELQAYGLQVDVYDPHADSHEVEEEYGFPIAQNIGNNYDAVVVAVMHDDFVSYNEDTFTSIMKQDNKGILFDIKGIYKGQIKKLTYWSL
jgi:UDP-N-acetyl-D-galactosamine dehydrogenase